MAEKDDLTLLIRQLHPKVGEFEVFELFSTAGKVCAQRAWSPGRGSGSWHGGARQWVVGAASLARRLRACIPRSDRFTPRSLQVLDVRLIMDERTGKCQGVGYVEMADTVGLQAGLMLNGKEMMGTQVA